MSACMSDVDLATLHKCRLDQRIKYQLSAGWVNRRMPGGGDMLADKKSKIVPCNLTSNYKQVTVSGSNADNNSNQPSVIEPCDCCCCTSGCGSDTGQKATTTCREGVACVGGNQCACQRSTITNGTQLDENQSDDVIGDDKERKVQSRRKCRHVGISCCKKAGGGRDKEPYLTRRRSGTWP